VERPAEVESSPEFPITHRCGFDSENTASVLDMRNRRLSWAERHRTLESWGCTLIQNPDGLSGFWCLGRIFLPSKSGRMDLQNTVRPVRGPDKMGSLDWWPVL
jgi:hypothetical protein